MSHSISPTFIEGQDSPDDPAVRLTCNAFFVLGLTPRARWPEIRRIGDGLLAALETGQGRSSYDTPLGPRPRTAAAVRRAMAQLRDPDERIQHEIWWEAPPRGEARAEHAVDRWPEATRAWGWRAR